MYSLRFLVVSYSNIGLVLTTLSENSNAKSIWRTVRPFSNVNLDFQTETKSRSTISDVLPDENIFRVAG